MADVQKKEYVCPGEAAPLLALQRCDSATHEVTLTLSTHLGPELGVEPQVTPVLRECWSSSRSSCHLFNEKAQRTHESLSVRNLTFVRYFSIC